MCHIKSICQAFYNGYLLFFMAPLRSTSALPFKLQEAAAPCTNLLKDPLEISRWGTV